MMIHFYDDECNQNTINKSFFEIFIVFFAQSLLSLIKKENFSEKRIRDKKL